MTRSLKSTKLDIMNASHFRLSVYRLCRLAIFIALAVCLRQVFAPLPNIQPLTALFFLVCLEWSLLEGLILSGTSMLLTAFFLGMGPWVFHQILAYAAVCLLFWFLIKVLPFWRQNLWLQTILAAILSFAYGVLIDSMSALLYGMPWWTYVAAGAFFNWLHAISSLAFYPVLYHILRRFSREKNRF